jgi:hypothetical protein
MGRRRSSTVPRLAALAFCGLLLLTACEDRSPTKGGTHKSIGTLVADLRLEPVPRWMEGYCHKAADDLGYAVLCPMRLPSRYDLLPCRGPTPKNELWGKYCFDYVLDSVFKGPPGYHGPFAANRRAGHLAIWTIAPSSDMYQGGLLGCPEGGLRKESARFRGHSGHWWACPATRVADLNSGHVAFQWFATGVVYGVSVHGINDVNRRIVRELLDHLDLVGPQS